MGSDLINAYRIHRALYDTILVSGVILLGLYLAFDLGWLARLVDQDKSYLSLVMLALYLLISLNWAYRMSALSSLESTLLRALPDLNDFKEINVLEGFPEVKPGNIDGFCDDQLNFHALGHFVSELLLKLGLMGTVIGFILMLMPIAEIQTFDPSTLQQLLSSMSGGMAVALYTTLTGLITSTLVKYQYYLADSAVIRITQTLQGTLD